MHKWFVPSEQVAMHLVSLFRRSEKIPTTSCHAVCRHTQSHAITCPLFKQKSRVCHTFRYWIHKFPMHFDMEHRLKSILKDFHSELLNSHNYPLSHLVDVSNVPSYDWMRNMSVRNPSVKHNRKVSLVFNHLEPDELAEHLTFLEHKVMRRISDYKSYAVSAMLKDNAKLERSIALFNGLSLWIQCMVLSKTTPQQRADVIVKFVNVSKKLREMQNFNTLMAVVGGLSHSALARLGKTAACIPTETQKTLTEMTELLSSASNFSNYRRALHRCKGFRIPILGVHMKDLISLHVALPDNVDGGLLNFRKMAQLSLIFQELAELQSSSPPIEANMDLVNTLRLSLDLAYTEDEIYELSLAREPRNMTSPQSSPIRPPVFAEWAAGVLTAPDPETIEKHVHAMVDAVFKNYDNDRDGYISQAEFEAISGNFPFIDSFCVLDADHDGMISKIEMRDYFIRANCHAFKNGFKHEFHETTYFKPTYCAHCTGLLWGIIKQGYKCKDCSINAHKHCKDLVVMECRRTIPTGRSMSVSGTSDAAVSRAKFRNRRRQQKSLPVDGELPPSLSLQNSQDHCRRDSVIAHCQVENLHERLAQAEEVHEIGDDSLIVVYKIESLSVSQSLIVN
uniref:Ras guanyl-releasing protein 3 n=1 Tax=Strigamia maritima TaxID=126957 RepID=T1JIP6_STRMM